MASALPASPLTDCCTSCTTPVDVNVPGPQGGAGTNGTNGTDGINAFSTIVGGATLVPAYGASVTVELAAPSGSLWIGQTQVLYVQSFGYFRVDAIPDTTHVTLFNLGYTGNVNGNGILTFTAGTRVQPGGLEGPAGTGAGTAFLIANNLSEGVAATMRSNLALGTIATQNANSVAITGGAITGITDLAVADGGTGSSTAAGARTNLGAAASGLATASGLTMSATDKVLGRSSAGAGAVEEIACTATGRNIIGQASVAAVQSVLGIGVLSVVTKTGGYVATTSDDVILVDATTGSIIIDLYAAATGTGRSLVVKKIDASANTVTIRGHLAETIDGSNTKVINSQWTAVDMVCDGTAFYIK